MIRLSKSVIGKEEIKAVSKVLDKEFLGMGEEVAVLENKLSEFFDSNAVCVNTGTSALQLAVQAAGIKDGDEVLVQSITYLASFQAISAAGAKPVACEINPKTFTIDLDDALSKVNKNTKAIMPVHYAGNPGDLDKIYLFAKKHNLRIIEDAAHAFGSLYNDKLIGSQGDIICFSFDGIKNITSGEGGAIISKDKKLIERIMDLRLLGVKKDSQKRYKNDRTIQISVDEQGWRYHMSNIMAAIGIEQFNKFPVFRKIRQERAKLYVKLLKNNNSLSLIEMDYDDVVPHIFPVILNNYNRDELRSQLLEKGIQTGIHYYPNHLLEFYKSKRLSVSETFYTSLLTLPLHPDISEDDVKYVVDQLNLLI